MRLPLLQTELETLHAGDLVALAGDTFPDWIALVDYVDAEDCRVTVTVLIREARREPMVHPECPDEHQPGVQCQRCLGYFLRYATP